MDLHRFCVKFYAGEPAQVKPGELIPVFHRWIQQRAVEGTLVDVADYAHLPQSPGVLLVSHEADYAMDSMEGPLGLLYSRKAASAGSLPERILAGFRAALGACVRLENEPEFLDRLVFKAARALFIANDRLNAPNTEESYQALRIPLATAVAKIYPSGADLRRASTDPRSRLAIEVSSRGPAEDAAELLARLA